MDVTIKKGIAKGTVYAPPSKSFAHRLLICAALADGQSIIEGVSQSVDMRATLECIKGNGAYAEENYGTVLVNGKISDAEYREYKCYESGSTLRFFIPISLVKYGRCCFTGSKRLMERGVGVYEQIFEQKGIKYEKTDTSFTVEGRLEAGEYNVRGDISSQFITGLLFALPLLDGDSVINITTHLESSAYIDITLDCLRKFGIEIEKRQSSFYIKGNQKYTPSNQRAEGDFSNSAFLEGFNLLGGEVLVLGLNEKTIQGDAAYRRFYKLINESSPTLDISSCPDLGPVLMALGSLKNGITLTGTRRLKIKESDRAEVMARELEKIGAQVLVYENSVTVKKAEGCVSAPVLDGNNDHRIVMALALVCSVYGGVITGAEAVSKSYPDFFEVIKTLGIEVQI